VALLLQPISLTPSQLLISLAGAEFPAHIYPETRESTLDTFRPAPMLPGHRR